MAVGVTIALLGAACTSSIEVEEPTEPTDSASPSAPATTDAPPTTIPEAPTDFGSPPTSPTAALAPATIADLDSFFASVTGDPDFDALRRLGELGDPRIAWLFTDVLRFTQPGTNLSNQLVDSWEEATSSTLPEGRSPWGTTTDHMIAWDVPAPPGYATWKRIIFELIEPGWQPFFDDADATIDWRWLSWGGVLIDDRPLDAVTLGCPQGCIPALNDPPLVAAGTAEDWLADDRLVFGIEVNGEAVAFPKNMMEIHEMVNITIGGRRLGIPYCTLCGSAQAWITDAIDQLPDGTLADDLESLELRTSGLLIRSNKVMYEFHTKSVVDTFTGEAVTGPLREAGVRLEQISVITTTWGAWKEAHPTSSVIAEDGGLGRTYPEDPLRGRDDNGPIFPIGSVDGRLGVQQPIIGVITAADIPVAFPVDLVRDRIAAGEAVTLGGVVVEPIGGGFVATDEAGVSLPTHQAFWFAWSQFHSDTLLYE